MWHMDFFYTLDMANTYIIALRLAKKTILEVLQNSICIIIVELH